MFTFILNVTKLKKQLYLVADGSVFDGGEGGGVAAVDPALLEVPERRHDQVVPPRRSKSILKTFFSVLKIL